MANFIKVIAGSGPFARFEMLSENGVRIMNRTVFKDGTVKVTLQGDAIPGPWLRTEEEWNQRTAGLPIKT